MKLKIMILLLFLFMVGTVGAYTINRTSPAQYAIENGTTVLFNVTVIDDIGNSTNMTVGVYNRTSRTGVYSLGAQINISNGTLTQNYLNLTFSDEVRVWWYIGVWDQQSEFNSTWEAQTIPANGSLLNLTNGADGVTNVAAVVNESIDVTEEVQAGLANNSQVPLTGNGSVSVVAAAQVNGSVVIIEEEVTLPTNESQVDLVGNSTIGLVSGVLVFNGSENITITTSSYGLASGSVTLTNASYANNISYWNYTYYTWQAYTDYVLASGVVTTGPIATKENNRTRWNYTYLNQTTLNESRDYNITDGFVFMNSSTSRFEGDTSYWNYSYPFSQANQENSTVRIMDIDDYYNEFITIWVPIRLVPQTQGTCDTTSIGTIYIDVSDNIFRGCNGSEWRNMSEASS